MNDTTVLQGKIIHLNKEAGWGFISSPSLKFTRIFFYWQGLKGNTLNFKDLERGMKVEFIAIEIPEKGWRAIKIKVVDADQS